MLSLSFGILATNFQVTVSHDIAAGNLLTDHPRCKHVDWPIR